MALKDSIRKRKRDQQLDAARSVITEELDALQLALTDALTEFEELLDQSIGAVPGWLEVDRAELRTLFVTVIAEQEVLLGPRAAAIVTARVDAFIAESLPADSAARRDAYDESARANWGLKLEVLAQLVEDVAQTGRETAESAQATLADHLEQATSAVAEQRESDPKSNLDDLKSKLLADKAGTASVVRETEAEVLEGQRRKIEELQEAWTPLERLAFAGADMAVDASERLRRLLALAVHAKVEAYPELVGPAGDWAPSSDPIRERKFNAPPPLPTVDREGSPSTRVQVDDARRVTAPINLKETQTEEYSREPAESAVADEEDEFDVGGEIDLGATVDIDATVDIEEMVELAAKDKGFARQRVDTDAPRNAIDTPRTTPALPPAGVTATMEVSVTEEEFREPAFRELVRWRRVEPSEMLLALGPPTAYFVFMTLVTVAYQNGLWAENPFSEWPWAFPSFVAFAIWAIGMPALLNWRVDWDGRRPRPVRMTDDRQEEFVDVDGVSIRLQGHRFDFAVTHAELHRWRDGGSGWVLRIHDEESAALFAAEANSARWEDSKSKVDAAEPQSAWRISEETLLHVADKSRGHD